MLCKDFGCKNYILCSGLCNRGGKKLPNMFHSVPLICQLPHPCHFGQFYNTYLIFAWISMIYDSVHWTMSFLSHKTQPGARNCPICYTLYPPHMSTSPPVSLWSVLHISFLPESIISAVSIEVCHRCHIKPDQEQEAAQYVQTPQLPNFRPLAGQLLQ